MKSTSADPYSNTYSAYFGSPAYPMDAQTGYPLNEASSGKMLRRLAVGFRTGDHTGSSVPFTAEGTGAFLFTGYMDLTDVFFKMAAVAAGETAEADRLAAEHFVPWLAPQLTSNDCRSVNKCSSW